MKSLKPFMAVKLHSFRGNAKIALLGSGLRSVVNAQAIEHYSQPTVEPELFTHAGTTRHGQLNIESLNPIKSNSRGVSAFFNRSQGKRPEMAHPPATIKGDEVCKCSELSGIVEVASASSSNPGPCQGVLTISVE